MDTYLEPPSTAPLEFQIVSTDGGKTWSIWPDDAPVSNSWILKTVREVSGL